MSVCVALLPAHNEELSIERSVRAAQQQCDRVIVVADNCTDGTVGLAKAVGAEVFETQGNSRKKAGALNQALAVLMPELADDDCVFVQDADSIIDPTFIATAAARLSVEPKLAGVGGTFRGGPGGGLVGVFQRNEYARYARDVRRLKGRVLVLTGTATLFRVSALRAVLEARASGALPSSDGVYDETVLTEDNELTQALLHLGYSIVSPIGCTLETEVMATWRDLYRQRLRWKRGALENLFQYGLTRVTWRYWGRQALTMFGCLVTVMYLASIVLAVATGGVQLHLVWITVTLVFAVERAVTVRDRGWRQQTLGASVVYEMPFDVFLQAVHLVAYVQVLLRAKRRW